LRKCATEKLGLKSVNFIHADGTITLIGLQVYRPSDRRDETYAGGVEHS